MIDATDLTVVRQDRTILHAPPATFERGAVHALVGTSGSGKTTFLHCLGLLERPSSGRVVIDGRDLTGASDRRRREFWRDSAAFVFQDYGLVDEWTVTQNILLSERRGLPAGEAGRRLTQVCHDVGLTDRATSRAAELSGGEKQRTGLARALYREAAYVFADEPTASLDLENRTTVIDLLHHLADQGACVVVATHDRQMRDRADAVVELQRPDGP